MITPSAARRGVMQSVRRWERVARRWYPLDLLARAIRSYVRHGGSTYAAAISYHALLSLLPLLLLAVAGFGFVIRDESTRRDVLVAITDAMPPGLEIRSELERTLTGIAEGQNETLSVVGLLGTLWTASGMVATLRKAMNSSFDLNVPRPYLRTKTRDLLCVVGILGLLFLSFLGSTALLVVRAFTDQRVSGLEVTRVWALVFALGPFLISWLTFVLLYRIIPYARVPKHSATVAGLLAAVGFEAAKFLFALYVTSAGRYQQVYGAIGGVVAFLVFVYLVATVTLGIAELLAQRLADKGMWEGRRQAGRSDLM